MSVSQQFTQSSGSDAGTFEVAGTILRNARYWAHYTHLLVGAGGIFLLYTTLLRFALVPRILAGVGAAAVLLQITALSMPLFGSRINFYLLAPLGLCHFALAFWLIAKGFADREGREE